MRDGKREYDMMEGAGFMKNTRRKGAPKTWVMNEKAHRTGTQELKREILDMII